MHLTTIITGLEILSARVVPLSVADPDLGIRGRPGLKNILFGPFGPHFVLKIRGGRTPRAPQLDPPIVFQYRKNEFFTVMQLNVCYSVKSQE